MGTLTLPIIGMDSWGVAGGFNVLGQRSLHQHLCEDKSHLFKLLTSFCILWLYLQIMATVAEIHERHDAVREVERKLLDLQQVLLLVGCIDMHQDVSL